ncbi:aminopeptidase P family N-terminal domain-containing protein, partial [Candidatus Symbiopectobacterium sp. NZEC135]|uniref:aminopeptidase P family N-terminal domain-containing protein n=1 Tax=Candidatus Symbiopectobacterium sp. NZEC135 TaxID=2820471 RepID=UPI0022262A7C
MTVNEPESYTLQAIPQPKTYARVQSTALSDETQRERLHRVLHAMRQQGLDALIIYADKEHGGNFEYLSGFIPRFEEALLIVAKNGAATYVMGNENLKLVPHARLHGTVLHAPCFSLPDQP